MNYKEVLKDRKKCVLFCLDESINDGIGWIGGNPPSYFDHEKELINENMCFYLTFLNPIGQNSMISIFIPLQYEDRLIFNKYPECSLIVVEHPVTSESALEDYRNPDLNKHFIIRGEETSDKNSFKKSFFIKFGGSPKHIQNEKYYCTVLKENNFEFLFQVDEEGYSDKLIKPKKNYPFGFGAIYIYAHILENTIENPTVGYWQYS